MTRLSPGGDRAFFDTAEFPWVAPLEENWRVIRKELDSVLVRPDRIPDFGDISDAANRGPNNELLSEGEEWKWFILYGFGHRIEENCARCPDTAKLVAAIPGMRSAIFSILAPGKHIPRHQGLYKGILRFHLGLKIPDPNTQSRIFVRDETRSWAEGQGMIFDDTFPHEVWNDSNERRVVLFVDFERPMPAPFSLINRMFLRWISATAFITDAIDRVRNPQSLADAKAARIARQM